MKYTIERNFFDAFKMGGIVDDCVDWFRHTYNLPIVKPRENKGAEVGAVEAYYKEHLPKKILEAVEAFDDGGLWYMQSPLIDEIEENLNGCKDDFERMRYINKLLSHFGKSGCGLSLLYDTNPEESYLERRVKDVESALEILLSQLKQHKQPINEEISKMVEAYHNEINRHKQQIEWLKYVSSKFYEAIYNPEENTIERVLKYFVEVMTKFATRLDALLLAFGFDLMDIQRRIGVYIIHKRDFHDVAIFIGSEELTLEYINAVEDQQEAVKPQQEQKPSNSPQIPPELDNETAKRYLDGAKEKGLMDNNFMWNSSVTLLAYFCGKMSIAMNLSNAYDDNNGQRVNWRLFEGLFHTKRGGLKKGYLRKYYSKINKEAAKTLEKKLSIINDIFKD